MHCMLVGVLRLLSSNVSQGQDSARLSKEQEALAYLEKSLHAYEVWGAAAKIQPLQRYMETLQLDAAREAPIGIPARMLIRRWHEIVQNWRVSTREMVSLF